MTTRLQFVKNKITLGLSAALLATAGTSAQAASFEVGEFDVKFDSTFSYGQSIRVEDRDFEFIGKSNHPRFNWTGYNAAIGNPIYSSAEIWAQPGAYSNNGDAGNLNFDAGDTFSQLIKGTHEFSIRQDDWGVFTRFMYFYDFAMEDGDLKYKNPVSGKGVNPCDEDETAKLVCSDFRLLDAFVWANFDLNNGNNPLSVRVGQQVLNWGESTMISHGINVNPVDIDRLKAAGAELKEAFIPVGMVWASLGLTENLTFETFYQYKWQETRLPATGSYFSTNDFASENGYAQNIQLGFTSNPDIDLAHLTGVLNNLTTLWQGALTARGLDASDPAVLQSASAQSLLAQMYLAYPTKVALKGKGDAGKVEAQDAGQYGFKLAWYAPELNETEFGFYYTNYHSRVPLISGKVSNFTQAALAKDLAYIRQNTITEDNITNLNAFAKGQIVYPEDIELFGLSFNTTVGETALSGEFAYRKGEPLQIDDVELLYAAMPEQLAYAGIRPDLAGISQLSQGSDVSYVKAGELAQGYIERDTMQFQMTATHLFGPSLGADSWALVGEAGIVTIKDMPEYDELRLNVAGTERSGLMTGIPGKQYDLLHMALSNGPETNPFPTATSWGYRLIAKGDYNNLFAGVNFSPRIVFSHDVNGTTPDPMFLFVEDRKSLGVTLNFNYQNAWSFDFGYDAFWGGGQTNTFADRDFVSFNIKYSI
ncbi:FIG067310: hypothetical protein [Pseudoalteromonas luteoviolacea B = ATCC 29581]|nr:FIG067310: hypothetical protein [Pseudoalteromonas luteoviolacea B = ATCC 29581]